MKRVSDFIGKLMAVIVLAVAALALFVPKTCLWIDTGCVNRNRNAELGSCDKPCQDSILRNAYGDGSGSNILCMAQYIRCYTGRYIQEDKG